MTGPHTTQPTAESDTNRDANRVTHNMRSWEVGVVLLKYSAGGHMS